jgi:ABC-type proline/glycine betaine transport system permease subunit
MEKLEKEIKIIDSKLDAHTESLIRIEADLKYHIKRSDNLENLVQKHEKLYYITMFIVAATPIVLGILLSLKRLSLF